MKCSIFIAPSVDGYIATQEGSVSWLESVGKPLSQKEKNSDLNQQFEKCFEYYIQTVDSMIIGRKLLKVLSSFNLTPEQWPYKNTKIFALSHSLNEVPKNLQNHIELHNGPIPSLIAKLEIEGYKHAYVDGGMIITSFLNLKLINEITLTQAPVLLGCGVPLFGTLLQHIKLENAQATVFPNDFIEIKYSVKY
jgi:dihydrofolate reductase